MLRSIEWDETIVDLRQFGQALRVTEDAIARRARRGWTPDDGARVLDRWAGRCARRVGLRRGPVTSRSWRDPSTDRPVLWWSVWTVPVDSGVTESQLRQAVERGRYAVRVLRMRPWWTADAP